uniref:Nudix hydrolase domain-containing protein n=1 Tax=Hyaloperonospora arabidopsidis (strain Emoy2) TaxID=559515 RepID=M4BYE4_HYAAE
MGYSVHCFETPLALHDVNVSLSSRFNRLAHPDAKVEEHKTQAWEQLKHHTPNLFNASKFRLHSYSKDHHSANDHHSALTLHFGVTDYASYVGLCCSSLVAQLLLDGERLHHDRFAFLSRKVGVAAALETTDGYVALLKRSTSVGLYQNLFDTPGGHPEPLTCHVTQKGLQILEADEDESEEEEARSRRTEVEVAVRREFFESITNEIHEEVNVAPELQQLPELLGVVLQTGACTPSFSFHVRTLCSAQELKELYEAGPADKFESVELELLSVEKLLAGGSSQMLLPGHRKEFSRPRSTLASKRSVNNVPAGQVLLSLLQRTSYLISHKDIRVASCLDPCDKGAAGTCSLQPIQGVNSVNLL